MMKVLWLLTMIMMALAMYAEIRINEIMAKNASFPDENGDPADWVELYNTGATPVDIGGYYAVDSHYSDQTEWWQIPATQPTVTTIPPGGFLVLFFDEDIDEGPLHINHKLGGSGDDVYLLAPDGTVVDHHLWSNDSGTGLDVDDVSLGRNPDGTDNWQFFGPGHTGLATPGATNNVVVNAPPIISHIAVDPTIIPLGATVTVSCRVVDPEGHLDMVTLAYGEPGDLDFTTPMNEVDSVFYATIGPFAQPVETAFIVMAMDEFELTGQSAERIIRPGYTPPILYINECMANNTLTIATEDGEFEDWAEIYNPGDTPVDLSGLYIVDDHVVTGFQACWRIPEAGDSTLVPAHGFRVIWFDDTPELGVLHVPFKLGADTDEIRLLDTTGFHCIDMVAWDYPSDTGLDVPDVSLGRTVDGGSDWTLFGAGMSDPATPGFSNVPAGVTNNETPCPDLQFRVYPNPFNPSANLSFYNPVNGSPCRIDIYNVRGEKVRTLVDTILPAGNHVAVWDGQGHRGERQSSGVYFASLKIGGQSSVCKMLLMK